MIAEPQQRSAETRPALRPRAAGPRRAAGPAPDPRAPELDAIQRRADGSPAVRALRDYQALLRSAAPPSPAVAQRMKRGHPGGSLPPAKRSRRHPGPQPVPPIAPPPALSANPEAADDEEGYCGSFQRVRSWNVANAVPGVIVQEVTRDFQVVRIDTGAALAGAALDAYVQDPGSSVHATETRYWELWTVDAAGAVGDGGTDTFGLCSIIPWNGVGARKYMRDVLNKTKGTFTMTGLARFYPTAGIPAGFQRGAVAAAGGLYSTSVDPTQNLPPAMGAPVNYTVTVTWNGVATYSKVT